MRLVQATNGGGGAGSETECNDQKPQCWRRAPNSFRTLERARASTVLAGSRQHFSQPGDRRRTRSLQTSGVTQSDYCGILEFSQAPKQLSKCSAALHVPRLSCTCAGELISLTAAPIDSVVTCSCLEF